MAVDPSDPADPRATAGPRPTEPGPGELRAGDLLALPSPHGPAAVARTAAAAVLRHAVDGTPGVRMRGCRIAQLRDAAAVAARAAPAGAPTGATAADPHALDVTVSVAARYGVDLVAATAAVRRAVVEAGERALGLPVRRVDVAVVDVFTAGSDEDGGGAP